MDIAAHLKAWLSLAGEWLGSTFAGLAWPPLPSDIPVTYLAVGSVAVAATLLILLIALVQRRKGRLLYDQIVFLNWKIEELRNRIIELEVAGRLITRPVPAPESKALASMPTQYARPSDRAGQ
jgi:hypothetical protein